MKHILAIHASYALGGAEFSLLQLFDPSRAASDCRYTVVLRPDDPLRSELARRGVRTVGLDVRYYKKSLNPTRLPGVLWNLLKVSRQIARLCRSEGTDTIYCNTHRALLYTWLRPRRVRVVCSCRDRLRYRMEKILVRFRAHRVIAVSEYIRQGLPSSPPSTVVYNGVSIPRYPVLHDIREQYGLAPGTVCIGNVGGIFPRKNQKTFIHIAEKLLRKFPDLHFFIVGEALDPTYAEELRSELRRRKLVSAFTFTGFVKDIPAFLLQMDLLVHTAREEPFGRVLIEAMACRAPVIAYNESGPAEIIRHAETGFLADHSEQMVKYAELLVKDPAKRTEIAEKAYLRVMERFDGGRYAERLEKEF